MTDSFAFIDPKRLGTGTPDGTKFLRDDQTWAAPGSDGVGAVRLVEKSAAAAVASTTSTVTYSTHITHSVVLPAGTWEITTFAYATFANATNASQLHISAPVASTYDPVAGGVAGYHPASTTSQGSVVSDGVAATVFTSQYRANGGGTSFGNTGTILAICRRTA